MNFIDSHRFIYIYKQIINKILQNSVFNCIKICNLKLNEEKYKMISSLYKFNLKLRKKLYLDIYLIFDKIINKNINFKCVTEEFNTIKDLK